jgi:hypothetical protein
LAAYPRIAERIAEVQSDVMRCLRRRTFAAFQAKAVAKFYDRFVTNHVSRSVAHNLRAVFRLSIRRIVPGRAHERAVVCIDDAVEDVHVRA